ncbi:MAG TPA: hypothetical protein VJM49_06745 [Acidimicrobiales bacterium]|nr:hypothetical protein [Acidimicrobiales bacterium]
MVDTLNLNGAADVEPAKPELPDVVYISSVELQQFPSPGTQRTFKAMTGLDYMAAVGGDADSADRTQTQIWTHLRKKIPGLAWDDCAEIAMQLVGKDGAVVVDPTQLASSAPSPLSAGSGE